MIDEFKPYDEREMTNAPISLVDAYMHPQLKRLMNVPNFDVSKMADETGIGIASLYAFRRGSVYSPRPSTLMKMISYLIPEAMDKHRKAS